MSNPPDPAVFTPLADLQAFLDASPSPFHVVASAAARLDRAGFREVPMGAVWTEVPGDGYVIRDGSIIAWRIGAATAGAPITLVGAHTDSPNLRVTPLPDVARYGWDQLHVEVYGGILNNSWLDRDLGLAGRVFDRNGDAVLFDRSEPLARIPQLAVHLDRNANDGLVLNRQEHLRPVWGVDGHCPPFAEWLATEAGIDQAIGWELGLYDVQPSAVLGVDHSMLASGRIDNQVSCWAAITALCSAAPNDSIAVVVLNDHEEIGSESTTGAAGAWLTQVLERLNQAQGGSRADFLASLTSSFAVSADSAHAIHPNYPDRSEPRHAPRLNHGPAIKTNANQRYATNASTAARFAAACDETGVEYQMFASLNTQLHGSTIGPITASRLAIDTVDVGIPQLSMHSARELCGTADPPNFAIVLAHLMSA